MSAPRLVSRDELLIVRTARKPWRCYVARVRERRNYPGWWDRPELEGCADRIDPGDVYVEYVGEAAAFESGTRYCRACALASWAEGLEEVGTPAGPSTDARLERATYRRHYLRGWRASGGPGPDPLDRADSRGEPSAWYDGYMDHATGRAKWHTLRELEAGR